VAEPSLDDGAERLYGVAPEAFVAERDALAKRLRAEGRGEEAAAVKRLARPTAAAWAVNQLVRREPEWVQALVTAGRRLEEAQQALLDRSGDRDALRAAMAGQREAIERLVGLAADVLREGRGSATPALLDHVRETLQAASLDPDARAQVCAGRLAHELSAAGIGLGGLVAAAPASAPPREDDARRRREAQAAERAARAALEEAERAHERARRAAEDAAERVRAARAEHEAARRALEDAG
jgi:hypothetical protein